jgi:hypothetical protein
MGLRKTLVLAALAGALAAPATADELGDLYRGLKSSDQPAPQWLHDALFPPQPAAPRSLGGEQYGDAGIIPFVPCGTFTDAGTTVGFANDYDFPVPPADCNTSFFDQSFNGPDVVYAFTLPGPFTVTASTCGAAGYDSCLGIVDAAGNLVAVNDDGAGCPNWSSYLSSCCLPAGDYFLIVDGYGNSAGNYTLTVSFGCAPCSISNPCEMLVTHDVSLPYHGTGSNVGAPNVYGSVSGDVAYRFTLAVPSALELATCFPGTEYDTDSYWFVGNSPCEGGSPMGYNDGDYTCGWATHVTWTCDAPLLAGTYTVLLSGYTNHEGNYELDIRAESCEEVEAHEAPATFHLAQNAPNPFNPSTSIAFGLAETGPALLVVHDLAGRQVAVLANGVLERGAHLARFDATRLSSGVYLYTLTAGGRSETRKMILMK